MKVKLRYRTRPSADSAAGHPSDPTKMEANIKNSHMSPAFKDSSDACLDSQPMMDRSIEPVNVTTTFEHGNLSGPMSIQPPPTMPLTTTEILSQRRRRKSISALKRSASTPNVRGHHNGDAGMTLAEKRRNKLGYHRTSIACSPSFAPFPSPSAHFVLTANEWRFTGHCRRRKIRCLVAPDDPHNRCVNCIRLKKECNFFPVDQQPPIERRPRNPSKAETRTSSSSNSSPALVGGHALDHNEPFNPYQALPLSSQGFLPSTAAWNNGLVSPMTRGTANPRPTRSEALHTDKINLAPVDTRSSIDFNQPPQQQSHWHSPFPDAGPMSAGHSSPGDVVQPYWERNVDTPLTPGYSPHISGLTSSLNSVSETRSSFNSFGPARNDSVWSAPTRSMSIDVAEDLPSSYYKTIYHHNFQPLSIDLQRRASEMTSPSLMTSANSSNASISEAHMGSLSAPVPSPQQHWVVPSAWHALTSSAVMKPTDFGNWYSEPALAKVQEEEIPPPYGEHPAILYAGENQ